MEVSGLIKKRALWWVIGSLGAVGIAIALLSMLLVFALLGVLISSSDSSSMEEIPVPDNQAFDIPAPLLPIYIQAENGNASWARLAAIHKVATNFGAEQAKRIDTIGGLGFPRMLWEAYKLDGDVDGKIDPDNPVDAIFSLANYFRLNTLDTDAALEAWFLNPNDASLVRVKEAEYAAMLIMPRNWLWPVIGYTSLSSPYGTRIDPVTGETGVFHDGIDIPAPRGTPVVAAQNGTVVQVSKSSNGYGNLIRLQHNGGIQSFYAHLSGIGVRLSQRVLRGEVIGWVGSTGKSTGPHLHFGMSQNGQSVNPQSYWNDQTEGE
ncbi:MAG TPA: M23 family metallopeptidase [Paenibacillus sp.]|uniref:M23 family metallopeptidase n=1 Tax=Paenibacillus sp. TaxID=58172 RepID=UPI002CF175D9|nr:M23 family metallopeptidase [Paenibacillus sp.]HUC91942.1 M23 family metallopeptidase [Paenibacillus sp.]